MAKKTKHEEPAGKDKIIDRNLLEFARDNYYKYGMAVLEDRAIPDFRDGNIPVTRRILWDAYEMGLHAGAKSVKSARVVGDTMGKYHPHGDSSIYGALINLTNDNSPIALVHGNGNWGSMSKPKAAAFRYTEMRLSKFSCDVLFNKFYMPVVEYVPNYDGSLKEPILLPSLLPIVLLNGKFGIAPGATSYIPTCTTTSVVKLLKAIYSGEEISPKLLYRTLRFTSVSGGTEQMPTEPADKQDRLSIFKDTKGRAVLNSQYEFDAKTRTLTITRYANHWDVEPLLLKILDIEGVAEARDDTSKNDKYAVITVILKKNLPPKLEKKIVEHIDKKFLTTRENYVLNFTERYINDLGQDAAKMHPMSLTSMVTEWVKWRMELERKACTYWIGDLDRQIHRLDLLMLACDNLDIIFKALQQKFTREELDAHLAKKLKITKEDARVITEMRVYQLRSLEKSELQQKKKDLLKQKSELQARHKKPLPFMAAQLDTFKFGD